MRSDHWITLNLPRFAACVTPRTVWVRYGKQMQGYTLTSERPLFSEREGVTPALFTFGAARLKRLPDPMFTTAE